MVGRTREEPAGVATATCSHRTRGGRPGTGGHPPVHRHRPRHSERRRTQESLREAKGNGRGGNRAKSEFLATMSHEIRTPMNGVLGMLSAAGRTPTHARAAQVTDTIRVRRMPCSTSSTTSWTSRRSRPGRIDLELVACDVRRDRGGGRPAPLAPGPRRKPDVTCADRIRGCRPPSSADPTRLRQILYNLVGNAIKFTESGHVTVRAGRRRT